MTNYAKTNIGNEGRVELHEALGLTGAGGERQQAFWRSAFRSSMRTRKTREIYGVLEALVWPRSTVRTSSLQPATGCVFPPPRTVRAPNRGRLGHYLRLHPGQVGSPLVPSRPMTPSCANSRRQCARRSTRVRLSTSLPESYLIDFSYAESIADAYYTFDPSKAA